MNVKPIYWLHELDKDANDIVGKKCANLGEMSCLGMPIPEGFALSVQAYENFINTSGLQDDVLSCLSPVLSEDSPSLEIIEAVSYETQQLIVSKEMPEELESLIRQYYIQLCQKIGITDLPVAIRSSGAISMPGQMETYLNVRGEDDVILNIKKVWASGYTPRAISWRAKREGMCITEAQIGVGVIRMIEPLSAGVGFTIHPNTGDRSSVFIEGNWGVGESIVQGLVSPDVYCVDKKNLQMNNVQIGNKDKFYILLENGIELQDVPEDKQTAKCLSTEEAVELSKMAIALEEHFLTPQDFEWVIENNSRQPYLVQSRPAKYQTDEKSPADKILDVMMTRFIIPGD